jgi:hypothetical protein
MTTAVSSAPFHRAHARTLNAQSLSFDALCPPGDRLAARVLVEYGAMFVAAPDVVPPSVCVFADEVEVAAFQRSVPCAESLIAGYEIRLQQSALESLLRARHEARNAKLDITPRDGAEAARRTFADGVRLWDSRVRPALAHWIANGRLSEAEAERLRSLAPREQALAVLDLEAEGNVFQQRFLEACAAIHRRARHVAASRDARFRCRSSLTMRRCAACSDDTAGFKPSSAICRISLISDGAKKNLPQTVCAARVSTTARFGFQIFRPTLLSTRSTRDDDHLQQLRFGERRRHEILLKLRHSTRRRDHTDFNPAAP